jgi:hypothetical protein
MVCTPNQIFLGWQSKKNEMGRACSTYGVEWRGAYRVLVGKPEGREHLNYQDVDGRIILRLIFRKWDGGERLD